jgi:predicted SprT family Zn-dependent metalloprotease
MDNAIAITDPSQLRISDRVTFSHQNREWTGHVAKKGRTHATVVCNDAREFRVPYQRLSKIPGAANQHVQTANERQRARFNAGDKVSFVLRGTVLHGAIVRLNPTRAHVVCDDGKEYQVPYGMLNHRGVNPTPVGLTRSEAELDSVARLARELMAKHQLSQWSFQFDNSTKRVGCCHYATQLLSLSHEFAKRASDEEIRETILHEIAHALVGKEHGHDDVWRAKAVELGCSGRRCHDLQFTPPRYIVKCERSCWVTTAERRRRGAVCTRCRGNVLYLTYTEERWASEREARSGRA